MRPGASRVPNLWAIRHGSRSAARFLPESDAPRIVHVFTLAA